MNASFDVLVGADGTRSRVRAVAGVSMVEPCLSLHADRRCAFGALAPVLEDQRHECDAHFVLDNECRQPRHASTPGQVIWRPRAVSFALTLPTACEEGHTLPTDVHALALLKQSVASLAEAPWDNRACRVTIGLLEAHSRTVVASGGWREDDEARRTHERFAHHVLRLMGRRPEGARDFAIFTNTMRFAQDSQRELSAHGVTVNESAAR